MRLGRSKEEPAQRLATQVEQSMCWKATPLCACFIFYRGCTPATNPSCAPPTSTGGTTHVLDMERGQVVQHIERWWVLSDEQ